MWKTITLNIFWTTCPSSAKVIQQRTCLSKKIKWMQTIILLARTTSFKSTWRAILFTTKSTGLTTWDTWKVATQKWMIVIEIRWTHRNKIGSKLFNSCHKYKFMGLTSWIMKGSRFQWYKRENSLNMIGQGSINQR